MYGFKESKLSIYTNSIKISGPYGEDIAFSEIESIKMVHQLPKIRFKKNGFALGPVNKGYFKTNGGTVIKLIINSESSSYILFVKKSGDRIYFSAKDTSNIGIYDELKGTLPLIR